MLDLTLEEVDGHVEFTTWAVVECHVPSDGSESPDDIGFDRRFGEPSRLTRPDEALRAVAAELRASGASRSRSGRARLHAACTTTSPTSGASRPSRRPRPRRGPAARGVCQDYAHCMVALCRLLRPAGALRLRPPAGRRRHARLGRGAARRTRTGAVIAVAVRSHARPPRRPALRHGRRRPRLRRRPADLGDVRGAVSREC